MADAQVLPSAAPLAVSGENTAENKVTRRSSQKGVNLTASAPPRTDGDASSPEAMLSPTKKTDGKVLIIFGLEI
jgi:hypothetical protein